MSEPELCAPRLPGDATIAGQWETLGGAERQSVLICRSCQFSKWISVNCRSGRRGRCTGFGWTPRGSLSGPSAAAPPKRCKPLRRPHVRPTRRSRRTFRRRRHRLHDVAALARQYAEAVPVRTGPATRPDRAPGCALPGCGVQFASDGMGRSGGPATSGAPASARLAIVQPEPDSHVWRKPASPPRLNRLVLRANAAPPIRQMSGWWMASRSRWVRRMRRCFGSWSPGGSDSRCGCRFRTMPYDR